MSEQLLDRNIEDQSGYQPELLVDEVEVRFREIIASIDQSVTFEDQERLKEISFGEKRLNPGDSQNRFGSEG